MQIFPHKKEKPTQSTNHSDELEISKDTNLGELAATYPHLADVLQEDFGLHCIGCFASSFDTVETGATIHGYSADEIHDMVERLKEIHSNHKNTKST